MSAKSFVAVVFGLFASLFLSSCGGSGTKPPISVSVHASATQVDGTDSVSLQAVVANDTRGLGVTWSVTGGGALSNTTQIGTTYTAPAVPATPLTVTVTATSVSDPTESAAATLTVPAALSITTTSLPLVTVGSPYSQTLSASGGIAPYTWKVISGTVPFNMNFSGSGLISGSPYESSVGTTNLTFQVTDSGKTTPLTATEQLSMTIAGVPPVTITTTSLPNATPNTAYSASIVATGGAGTLSYSLVGGALPTGLSLSQSGAVSGTPTVSGRFSFLVYVTDDFGNRATQNFSITVGTPISIASSTLPTGYVGTAYSQALSATGGTGTGYTWTVANGSTLPGGLSLSAGGVISGTPTTPGLQNFSVNVTDSASDIGTGSISITIDAGVSITTGTTLPAGYVGAAYSQTLAATGGSGTGYTWTVTSGASSLTAVNLSLSAAGVLSGTPSAAGTPSFTVKVTDSASNSTTATFTLTVDAAISITTGTTLPAGYVGTAYSKTLAATGGSGTGYTWAVTSGASSLTAVNLSLSAAGVLSGTPSAAGTPSFTVKVTDSASNSTTATFTLTVDAAISITTGTTLPAGYVGTAYSQTLAATGGSGTGYTWAVTSGASSLTAVNLSLSAAGVLSGTPSAAGTPSFTVKVTDSASNSRTATFTLTVDAAISITTGTTLPAGYVGMAYSQTLAATGGSGTGYAWTITSGASNLTALNLSLSGAGVLSGTPNGTGTPSFTAKVTDSANNSITATFNLTVNAGISITTATTLPTGYVGTAYSQTLAATGGSGTGYTWTVTAGASSLTAVNLSLSGAGVLSGTPLSSGTPSFTVKVTDSSSNTTTVTFGLTISPALAISAITLPTGYQGTAYPTTTFAATGGSGTGNTWSWVAASGSSLPAGLSLSAAGVITGTPTGSGTSSVVVTVKDSVNNSASSTLALTIQPTLSITTTSPLKTGIANSAYSQTFAATGGSGTGYTWAVTAGGGTLTPLNLNLSSAGVLSGTPTANGSASFTVQVTDSASHTLSAPFTLTVNSALGITTTSLPAATTAVLYSQTLAAAGGSGTGYTWAVSGANNLATFNLSLSAAGVISGTPTSTGTASFTAQVTDSLGDTATMPLTIAVYNPLSLPAANPSSLPTTGNVGTNYSGTITGSGGSGTYSWTVTGLSDNLTSSPTGATLTISGIPGTATTVTFNVKLTDTVTGSSVTQTGYSIVVGNALPMTLPAANPSSLGAATINVPYTGSISSSGGVGPYVWTINGVTVTAGGLALTDGLTATSGGTNTLSIAGTPTTTGSVPLTLVQVTDSLSSTETPVSYSITVNPAPAGVSGQIMLNNGCGVSGSLPPFTVSINTTPVQTTTTDNNGNYSFASVTAGTYTVTPTIPGATSVFYPATQSVTVAGSAQTANFNASIGYSVSGSVTYTGADTGQVYLNLVNTNCGGNGGEGTSIPFSAIASGGAFTINGVPPGSYNLVANIDNLGQGTFNATNPTATTAVTVSSANVTGIGITPIDPTLTAPTATPTINSISPMDSGVVINYQPITNSNKVESVSFYTIEWSTDSTFTSPAPSSVVMPATGTGTDVWILNSNLRGVSFTNTTTYYFRVRGEVAGGAGPWTVWGGGTPTGVTVNPPPSGVGISSVTGAVTIPSDITPTGPLYVGFYDMNTNNVYATMIPLVSLSNTTPNTYTVNVPNGSNYVFFGILDQNNDGLVDADDVTNVNSNAAPVVIPGGGGGENLTLPDVNSTATVTTQYYSDTSWNGTAAVTSTGYNLNFNVKAGNKLPVAVQLVSESNANVISPVDLGNYCQGCGHPQFSYYASISSNVPNVGDTYTFMVTYSDSPTPVSVVATVTGVVPTAYAPSNMNASGNEPIYTWYDNNPPSNYLYSFYVSDSNGNTIWQIPSNNSNLSGFPSSITEINTPTDPTGDTSNLPNPAVLTVGNVYNWSITAIDPNGNQAQTQVYYIP